MWVVAVYVDCSLDARDTILDAEEFQDAPCAEVGTGESIVWATARGAG